MRPETYASCLRSDTARARTLNDQRSLEVGNTGEHGQDHAPGRCCRISPRFGYRTKTRPGVLYALCDFLSMPLQTRSYLLMCRQMAVLRFGAPDCPGSP